MGQVPYRAGGLIGQAGLSPSSRRHARTMPGLPGSLAVHLQLCNGPTTPVGPLRLTCSGASGAAPALTRTKAPALRISGLN